MRPIWEFFTHEPLHCDFIGDVNPYSTQFQYLGNVSGQLGLGPVPVQFPSVHVRPVQQSVVVVHDLPIGLQLGVGGLGGVVHVLVESQTRPVQQSPSLPAHSAPFFPQSGEGGLPHVPSVPHVPTQQSWCVLQFSPLFLHWGLGLGWGWGWGCLVDLCRCTISAISFTSNNSQKTQNEPMRFSMLKYI